MERKASSSSKKKKNKKKNKSTKMVGTIEHREMSPFLEQEYQIDDQQGSYEANEAHEEGSGGNWGGESNIMLHCSHPNLSREANFEIMDWRTNKEKFYYDIQSTPSMEIERYGVESHNHLEKSTLDFASYDFTLKEWLEKMSEEGRKEDGYSKEYLAWGVYRPSEESRQLMRAILLAVAELHVGNEGFHSALQHPENFEIKKIHNFEGAEERDAFRVTLLYDNMDLGTLPQPRNVTEGKEYDFMTLSSILFDSILDKNYNSFPEDLQDLYVMLSDVSLAVQNIGIIVNHPSLWHWKLRFYFFDKFWKQLKQGGAIVRGKLTRALTSVKITHWKNKVQPGTPFDKILKNNNYGITNMELLCFVRIITEHIGDTDHGIKVYINLPTEGEYENMQFVEAKITEVFPLLLVQLYKGLDAEGLYL